MNLKNGKNFVIKKIKNLDNANVFRLFILSVAIISILNMPVFNQDNYKNTVNQSEEIPVSQALEDNEPIEEVEPNVFEEVEAECISRMVKDRTANSWLWCKERLQQIMGISVPWRRWRWMRYNYTLRRTGFLCAGALQQLPLLLPGARRRLSSEEQELYFHHCNKSRA